MKCENCKCKDCKPKPKHRDGDIIGIFSYSNKNLALFNGKDYLMLTYRNGDFWGEKAKWCNREWEQGEVLKNIYDKEDW